MQLFRQNETSSLFRFLLQSGARISEALSLRIEDIPVPDPTEPVTILTQIPKVLLFGNTNYYYSMLADESEDNGKKKPFHRRGSRHKRYTVNKQTAKTKRQKKAKAK